MALSIVLCNFKKITINLKHLKVCDYICHFFPCIFYSLSPTENSHVTNHPEKQAKADKCPNKKIMENEYQYLIDCSG